MRIPRSAPVVFLLGFMAMSAWAQVPRDPAVQDQPRVNASSPGGTAEVKIPIGSTRVNALFYGAQGPGVHPTVVLLHGFPGNERNLDIAQALRRAGYHAVYFNYRGSWGSGGAFSFGGAREDVAAVLAFLRTPAIAEEYGIDVRRISLLGHSMGGWLALAGLGDDASAPCAVALAPWDVGTFGTLLESGRFTPAEVAKSMQSYVDPEAGPLRGTTIETLVEEARRNAASWTFASLAPKIRSKRGYVIVSTKDQAASADMAHAPLEAVLRGPAWKFQKIEDDHGFSHNRIAVTRSVIKWLNANCRE
ncbi:MAG TPA: alpha/beta fold hydrolase [Thermoanaerobaculia bacterium]|jgi:pimeloyl-ACP methyl ester carboxylesterase